MSKGHRGHCCAGILNERGLKCLTEQWVGANIKAHEIQIVENNSLPRTLMLDSTLYRL